MIPFVTHTGTSYALRWGTNSPRDAGEMTNGSGKRGGEMPEILRENLVWGTINWGSQIPCDTCTVLGQFLRMSPSTVVAAATGNGLWKYVIHPFTGAYLAHFMGRFFQCSSGPPSQINMLYSNESIY